MGINNNVRKQSTKVPVWKKILIFLAFEFAFSVVTMPFLVFYGPFENIKRIIVGASWNSLRHQFIAKVFLSDEAIARILGNGYAVDPETAEQELQILKLGSSHKDKIEVYDVDGGDYVGKMMIIYDPTRIAVGYSSQMPKAGETTSAIAKKNSAIAAINAGGFMDLAWAGTGGAPMGFIYSRGKMVYNQSKDENVKVDTAAFSDKGMLIVGRHSIAQLKKYGIKEGVSFGPPLIVNGKPTIKKGDGGWGIAPRTAMGQREDGAVLFLVIDGRRLGSLGATLKDVQDILLQYKAVNAVNLDGGSSTTMYFNGKVINKPSDALGERAVPTVFMVMPSKKGE